MKNNRQTKARWMGMMVVGISLLMGSTVNAQQYPNTIRTVVNGTRVISPDTQPFTDKNNHILVPVRFISEELGAVVGWDASTGEVSITNDGKAVILAVDPSQPDAAAVMKGQRVFVHLRVVSEALGAQVKWDGKASTVYIDNGKAPKPQGKFMESHGFVIKTDTAYEAREAEESYEVMTKAKLDISLSKYPSQEYGCIITMIADYTNVDGNVPQQYNDMEAILRQQLSEAKVREIMDYVRTKKDREDDLNWREFYDGNYRVSLRSTPGAPVTVDVYYKDYK